MPMREALIRGERDQLCTLLIDFADVLQKLIEDTALMQSNRKAMWIS